MSEPAPRYYSVDRRGFYKVGGALELYQSDPYSRIIYESEVPSFTQSDVSEHLTRLFPKGLSLHGWEWMATRNDVVKANENGQHYVRHEIAIELVFEFVRRSSFPAVPSRLESYFAFKSLEAAKAFAPSGKPIYRVEAAATFRADQRWLLIGLQGARGSFCAHQYWAQIPSSEPHWEILLSGPIKVLEQV